MNFAVDIPRAPAAVHNSPNRIEAIDRAHYQGKIEPKAERFSSFAFEQTTIPLAGGQQLLRLRKPLNLKINRDTLQFTVDDWGITMDCLQLPQLPRQIARKFLTLLSAAENELLTETEQADWLKITDYIDFTQFSVDRSPPRYMEGTLQSNAEVVIVEWHDGSRERLNKDAARALSDINPGEQFSAFVKLGKDDKTLQIERVSFVRNASEKDWDLWPKKS